MPGSKNTPVRVGNCKKCGRKLSQSNQTGECRSHWTPPIDAHRNSGHGTGGGTRTGSAYSGGNQAGRK